MAGQDIISQGELGAWMDDEAGLRKARQALTARFQELLARLKAGATVQRGFYRVVQRRVSVISLGPIIVDRTAKPMGDEEWVEVGARTAKPKKGA